MCLSEATTRCQEATGRQQSSHVGSRCKNVSKQRGNVVKKRLRNHANYTIWEDGLSTVNLLPKSFTPTSFVAIIST